ncbi:hypothetical protein AAY473_015307 [Plecturocebus cupreus]
MGGHPARAASVPWPDPPAGPQAVPQCLWLTLPTLKRLHSPQVVTDAKKEEKPSQLDVGDLSEDE